MTNQIWFIFYYALLINAVDSAYIFTSFFDYNDPSNNEWHPSISPANDPLCPTAHLVSTAPCLMLSNDQSVYRSISTIGYHSIVVSLGYTASGPATYEIASSACFVRYVADVDGGWEPSYSGESMLESFADTTTRYVGVHLAAKSDFNNNSFTLELGAFTGQKCFIDGIYISGTPYASPTTEPTKQPTAGPTTGPTKQPTVAPTTGPTKKPTVAPNKESDHYITTTLPPQFTEYTTQTSSILTSSIVTSSTAHTSVQDASPTTHSTTVPTNPGSTFDLMDSSVHVSSRGISSSIDTARVMVGISVSGSVVFILCIAGVIYILYNKKRNNSTKSGSVSLIKTVPLPINQKTAPAAVAMADLDTLPSGWIKLYTDDNRIYYQNNVT
eukprot:115122_1